MATREDSIGIIEAVTRFPVIRFSGRDVHLDGLYNRLETKIRSHAPFDAQLPLGDVRTGTIITQQQYSYDPERLFIVGREFNDFCNGFLEDLRSPQRTAVAAGFDASLNENVSGDKINSMYANLFLLLRQISEGSILLEMQMPRFGFEKKQIPVYVYERGMRYEVETLDAYVREERNGIDVLTDRDWCTGKWDPHLYHIPKRDEKKFYIGLKHAENMFYREKPNRPKQWCIQALATGAIMSLVSINSPVTGFLVWSIGNSLLIGGDILASGLYIPAYLKNKCVSRGKEDQPHYALLEAVNRARDRYVPFPAREEAVSPLVVGPAPPGSFRN